MICKVYSSIEVCVECIEYVCSLVHSLLSTDNRASVMWAMNKVKIKFHGCNQPYAIILKILLHNKDSSVQFPFNHNFTNNLHVTKISSFRERLTVIMQRQLLCKIKIKHTKR